jgi:hypothetical protein
MFPKFSPNILGESQLIGKNSFNNSKEIEDDQIPETLSCKWLQPSTKNVKKNLARRLAMYRHKSDT